MKKLLISTLTIFIFLAALVFVLKTDVPVAVVSDEKRNLSLNNKTHIFKLRSDESFNAIAIRLLTYTKLIPGKVITFSINDAPAGRVLAESQLSKGWVHGEFYKFSFDPLKANKTYYLEIKSPRGVPYKITTSKDGQLLHKLYKRKSLAHVIYFSSLRAAHDWFRFGPLYLVSIFVYLGLLALLISGLVTKQGFESDI